MSDRFACPNEEGISHRILTKVAETIGEDPESLSPPLYEVIDTDALEILFREHGRRPNYPVLVFTYSGCRILVHGPDEVSVDRIEKLPTPEN